MRANSSLFDHGRWHYELIEALGCSRTLRDFCSDEGAVHAYLRDAGRPQQVEPDGQLIGVDDEKLALFVDPFMESIETAISAYRRQLIVVIASITEAATTEAFQVLFIHRPLICMDRVKCQLRLPSL
jgi:hypothetical protein